MGFYAVAGWQPLSDTGAIQAGGTLEFYASGASVTPKTVYTDKALTAGGATSRTLDANGRVTANIFLQDDTTGYRVVLKNSGGTTIWTRDEQFGLAMTADEVTRRREIARSPFDHNAVGDGSTNDATALAAALAAADGVLDLEGKTYRCDSTLALRSGITIRNGTLDFSNASLSAGLDGSGTEGSASAVSSATTGGQSITPGSVSGLAAGDLVRLRSSDTLATSHKFAELFRIEQVSGADVLVDGVILGTYSTSPQLEEITPISDVRLKDLTIVSPSGGFGINLSLCQRVRMDNVTVKNATALQGVRILSCYDVSLTRCSILQTSSAETIGIIVADACRDVRISNCHIERALEPLEIGEDYGTHDGVCRDIKIFDCDFVWCGQVEIAAGARYVEFRDNTIQCDIAPSVASTPAILIGGADVRVSGNHIRNPEGPAITITALVSCDYIKIDNNTIIGGETDGIRVNDASFTIESLTMSRNEIRECAGKYIDVIGTELTRLEISGNTFLDGTGTGVAVDLTTSGASSVQNCSVVGNHIDCGGGSAYTTGVSHSNSAGNRYLAIDDNRIVCDGTTTQTGISLASGVAYSSLSRNVIGPDAGGTGGPIIGIALAATMKGVIASNRIDLTENAAADSCIKATAAATSVTISNNYLYSSGGVGKGIYLAGTGNADIAITGNRIDTDDNCIDTGPGAGATDIIISGNSCTLTSTSASSYVIGIDPTDAGSTSNIAITGNILERSGDDGINTIIRDVDGITVCGNVIINGTYGLDIDAGSTEAMHDGNVFTGQATGTTNGTFDTAGDSA